MSAKKNTAYSEKVSPSKPTYREVQILPEYASYSNMAIKNSLSEQKMQSAEVRKRNADLSLGENSTQSLQASGSKE